MPTPPISREEAERTLAVFRSVNTDGISLNQAIEKTAEAMGVSPTTIASRLRKSSGSIDRIYGINPDWTLGDKQEQREAALKGERGFRSVLPGFQIKQTSEQLDASGAVQKQWIQQRPEAGEVFELPAFHRIKGVSALLDEQGKVRAQWIKTNAQTTDPASLVEEFKKHFEDFQPGQGASKPPALNFENKLSLFPLGDPHIGLLAWSAEAGDNWDLKIAVRAFRSVFAKAVAAMPATKQAIYLVGGDTLHADDNTNLTPRSGHHLQVDGRHQKTFLTACELLVEHINLLLTKHESVEVVVLPGNHDVTSAAPIAFFLLAWFRNEPRVCVDTSPSVFRFRQFGRVMFGFTHGHTLKLHKDFPSVMAAREPEKWGATKHRFGHGFHVHHRSEFVSEGGGVTTETHPILAPTDAHHYGRGYFASRLLQAIVYDPDAGEVMRVRVSMTGDEA